MIQIKIRKQNGDIDTILEKQLEKLLVMTMYKDETFAAATIFDTINCADHDLDCNLVPEDFIDKTIEIIQL
jgi:hypothetical protein